MSYILGHPECSGIKKIRKYFVQAIKFRKESSTLEYEKILTYYDYEDKYDKEKFDKFERKFDNNEIQENEIVRIGETDHLLLNGWENEF